MRRSQELHSVSLQTIKEIISRTTNSINTTI